MMMKQLFDIVSDALINGGVIGWFNGRAEFGPRALGGQIYSGRSPETRCKGIAQC